MAACRCKFARVDADGKHGGMCDAIPRGHNAVANEETQSGFDVRKEILAIVPGLEAYQVIGKHRFDQLAMVRNTFDYGACRPRCMQEEPKRLGDTQVTQFRSEREEMVVLDPVRRVRLVEPKKRPRHEGVHFAIRKIIPLRGSDQIGS